jgi:hypothetical protein
MPELLTVVAHLSAVQITCSQLFANIWGKLFVRSVMVSRPERTHYSSVPRVVSGRNTWLENVPDW